MPETGTEEKRPCVSVEFADLVVALVGGQTWSQALTASRKWLPTFDLAKQYDQLIVCVTPRTLTLTPANRGSTWHDAVCEIGVMKKPKLDETDPATVEEKLEAAADAHAGLVEELVDYFRSQNGRSHRLVGDRKLKFNITQVEEPTVMLLEHLFELHQCTSVIRLTGRTQR